MEKNLPVIQVNFHTEEKDVAKFCTLTKGVKTTGDHDVTDPPETDTEIHTQSDKVKAIHDQRVTDKSPDLTRAEQVEMRKLRIKYKKTGVYIEGIANDVAIAAGDVKAGEAVVLRCGYTLKGKGSQPPREFEVTDSGPGWLKMRVKSAGDGATYLWRGGFTQDKDHPPTEFFSIYVTHECQVMIKNTKSGQIVAFQFAIVLPVRPKRTKKADPNQDKKPQSSNIAAFSIGVDPYNWSDFIYLGCK
jgi:hypothetical protein